MANTLKQPFLTGEEQIRGADVVLQVPSQSRHEAAAEGAGALGSTKQVTSKDASILRIFSFISRIFAYIRTFFKGAYKEVTKSAQPAKAGLASALCSLLCFAPPPFDIFNRNGVWAVVTADFVLEANVGLTIMKGLNRTLGTLAAAVLALGVNYYAVYLGAYQPFYIMGWAAFIAALATMFKFRRPFKDRWNYAVAMSMITFHILILSKSEYKIKIVLPLIRLATIVIGFLTMSLVNLGIAPIYAGSGINKLVAKNFERAGSLMERCVTFYVEERVLDQVGDILTGRKQDDSIHKCFTEMVATDAECGKLLKAVPLEPCHGRFFYGFPWELYTHVADNLRYILYDVIALDSCLRAEIQAPGDLRHYYKEEMMTIGKECAEIFRLLGESIGSMRHVDCSNHLKIAEEWVMLLQHKIAKHTETILGGAINSKDGHDRIPGYQLDDDAAEFEDALSYSYSDSVFNTPAPNTPLLTQNFLVATPTQTQGVRSVTPTHSFSANSRVGNLVDGTPGLIEEKRRELKRETKRRISALSLIKFASLLIELAAKARYMVELVTELGTKARFDGSSPSPSAVSSPKAGSHYV